ncbi:hypothetical protein SADUNF_Sadunf09G0036100 [Salix dunnii]|uniref:Protein EARLY FLOWERING 4 domain-containing protein n=1 Tax=Salix dunnii TaxID=1413687 RepID=A0A835JXH2_9ROSI|nr:hypothetical protein SADUNF_Sadunf09G0036100 [Salix dunnii]
MNNNTVTTSPKQNKRRIKNDIGEAKKEEECDAEAWDTLSKSFKQVQSVLDHNSDLIKQVNANHQSKIPDNLVKNVSLIREINGNISKVMSIYSDLSFNVSNIVVERRREDDFKPAGLGFTALYAYVIRHSYQSVDLAFAFRWTLGLPSGTGITWMEEQERRNVSCRHNTVKVNSYWAVD